MPTEGEHVAAAREAEIRAEERAQIVAFLRVQAQGLPLRPWDAEYKREIAGVYSRAYSLVADCIERGEYVQEVPDANPA